jgi:hypothetical protein
VSQRANVLSGSLGLGHDVIADRLTSTLCDAGWESRTLACMSLLGRVESRVGDRVFRWLNARPTMRPRRDLFNHYLAVPVIPEVVVTTLASELARGDALPERDHWQVDVRPVTILIWACHRARVRPAAGLPSHESGRDPSLALPRRPSTG